MTRIISNHTVRLFLTATSTLAARIVRAKNKIREAKIPYQVPSKEELPARLDSVLRVIYLVFNEGYSASFVAHAVDAGAKITMPVADMFWGDRYGTLEDPFGHRWSVATHIRDMSPHEMEQAMAKLPTSPCP